MEADYRLKFEVARWQVWRTLCPPNKKQISLTDLLEFPEEKVVREQTRSTEERFRALVKRLQ